MISARFWPQFGTDSLSPPLLYFDDSTSWLAFAQSNIFSKGHPGDSIYCPDGQVIFRLKSRLDSVPFHMESKMSFSDSTSPTFFKPVMFSSSPEVAARLIPDVKSTEDWLQLLIHEYFHAFQFAHARGIRYLADSIEIKEDSLDQLYLKYEWFSQFLKEENEYLLKAISTVDKDSTQSYIDSFFRVRRNRRTVFNLKNGYDIAKVEKFWEKIEGTARYVEYHTGFIFNDKETKAALSCDILFENFKQYETLDFLRRPWFTKKTEIMRAYYYVTGFNLCRVMDKLKIQYKDNLF